MKAMSLHQANLEFKGSYNCAKLLRVKPKKIKPNPAGLVLKELASQCHLHISLFCEIWQHL